MVAFFGAWVHAGPVVFNYQGQLTDDHDNAIASTTTSVIFSIYDPAGTCLLYQESQNVPTDANGYFTVQIGQASLTGGKRTGIDPGLKMTEVFDPRGSQTIRAAGSLNCQGSGYTTNSIGNDQRVLKLTIAGTELNPGIYIGSVPFATSADNAAKLADLPKENFFRSTSTASPDLNSTQVANLLYLAAPTTCSASQVLQFDGTGYTCVGLPASGVTSVTGTAPVSVTAGATPVVSMTQASTTAEGYLSAADYVKFDSKLGTSTVFGGDVSGSYNAISVDKIKGIAVSATTPTASQILIYNGTSYTPASLSNDITIGTTGVATLKNTGITGTYYKVTTDAQGRVTSGSTSLGTTDLPNIPWSMVTTAPTTLSGYGIADAVKNSGTTPSIQSGTDASKPSSGWTAGRLYVAFDTKKIYRDDGTAWVEMAPATAAGVTNVATGTGLTGGSITSAGTISLAPIADGKLLANITGVSAAPSATTLTEFLDKSMNSQGAILFRNGTSWTGLAPGTAGQVLSTSGAGANPSWVVPSVSLAGDVTGASGTNTVEKIRNVGISTTAPTATGQVLRYNQATTLYEPAYLSMFDLRSTVTGTATFAAGCTSNQTLTWTSATDNLACSNISLPVAQITGVLPVANGGTGTSSLPATFVLNGGQNGSVVAGTNDTNDLILRTNGASRMKVDTSGRVGIGTMSPTTKLDIYGTNSTTLKIVDGNQGLNKVLVSDANGVASWGVVPALVAEADTLQSVISRGSTATSAATFNGGLTTTSLTASADITTSAKVGIGTSTPRSQIHVYQAGTAASILQLTNGATGANATDGLQLNAESSGEASLFNYENQSLKFGTNSQERMRIDKDGNVGIGTNAPGYKLEIRGSSSSTLKIVDGNQGAGKILVSDANGVASWTSAASAEADTLASATGRGATTSTASTFSGGLTASNLTVNGSAGIGTNLTVGERVAIGTTAVSPGYQLYVGGNGFFSSPGGALPTLSAVATGVGAGTGIALQVGAVGSGTNRAINIINPGSGANNHAIYSSSTAQSYFAGKIGIGISAPTQELDVRGKASFSNATGDQIIINTNTSGLNGNLLFQNSGVDSWQMGKLGDESFVLKDIVNSKTAFAVKPNGALLMKPNGGYVGIGTWNATAPLEVVNIDDPEIRIRGGSGLARLGVVTSGSDYIASGSTLSGFVVANDFGGLHLATGTTGVSQSRLTILPTGQVGIGTIAPNPTGILHVKGRSNGLGVSNWGSTIVVDDDTNPRIAFGSSGSSPGVGALIGENAGSLEFVTGPHGTGSWGGNTRMTITPDGKVGVGVSNPQVTLDVNGEMRSKVKLGYGTQAASFSYSSGSWGTNGNAPVATVSSVLNGDLVLVEANCTGTAGTGSSSRLYMRIDVTLASGASGNWDMPSNESVLPGDAVGPMHSTGLYRLTASGDVTFKPYYKVEYNGGNVEKCNIIARVIGR